MKKADSPRTNKIILGTVQFGLNYGINNSSGKPSDTEITNILELARLNGITMLDTAEAYGSSQEAIGNYHKRSPHRFGVITKFSSKRPDLPADLEQRVAHDLQTLHVKSLYAYMFHSFADFEAYFGSFREAVDTLKRKKMIQRFGVSIYTNAEFERLLQHEEINLVQLPFNLLDNNFQRSALIKKAKQKGIEIHTRSVFLQGLFFKEPSTLPLTLASLAPYVQNIRAMSNEARLTVSDLALNYAVQQNEIDHVLVGVDTAAQLQANINSLNADVSGEILRRVDEMKVGETELLNPTNWNK